MYLKSWFSVYHIVALLICVCVCVCRACGCGSGDSGCSVCGVCRGCAGEEDWGLNLMEDLDDVAYEKVHEAQERIRAGRLRVAARKAKGRKKKEEDKEEEKEAKGGMGLSLLFGGVCVSIVLISMCVKRHIRWVATHSMYENSVSNLIL